MTSQLWRYDQFLMFYDVTCFAGYKIELRAMYYGLGSFANNMFELRAMYYGLGSFAVCQN